MTVIDAAVVAYVLECQDDTARLAVAADWLEDHGGVDDAPVVAALRWMVIHRRRPYYDSPWHDGSNRRWTWWCTDTGTCMSDIPREVYWACVAVEWRPSGDVAEFDSWYSAVVWLAGGLARIEADDLAVSGRTTG